MIKSLYKVLIVSIISFIFTGCFLQNNVDIAKYTKNVSSKIEIDETCKHLYKNSKIKVAVVPFSNHTNLPLKMSKSFIPLIETMLLDNSNIELYSRIDMNKIDSELKLQDSGLLDPKSIVEFGKLSGVNFLISGSVDFIEHSFSNYSKGTRIFPMIGVVTGNKNFAFASLAVNLGSMFFDGTTIKSAVTVTILDVASGKIVFAEQVNKETKLNSTSRASADEIEEAVKSSISSVLPKLHNKFKNKFLKTSYVSAIKTNGKKYIAKINLGHSDNIKQGDEFSVYNTEIFVDPLTNKTSCSKIKTPIVLKAIEHIGNKYVWTSVTESNDIKLFQLVQEVKE